jgi:hypothetical protein
VGKYTIWQPSTPDLARRSLAPGLPDGIFSHQTTKNPNLDKFWSALDWKMLRYFMAICNILWTFGIFYDNLVHFVFFWYIFSGFGFVYQEKSGNPAWHSEAVIRTLAKGLERSSGLWK